jgi:hypothetical protein
VLSLVGGVTSRKDSITSVNVISSNSSLQTLLMQPKQDLQALQTDLSSGNLVGAQKDFATFTQDAWNLFQNSNNKQSGAQIAPSQVSTDLQALQSALSSGNLTAAQKAFAAFQQDLQTAAAGRKHHHHHHQREEDTKSSDANSQNNSNGAAPNGASSAVTATSGITSGALMKSLLSAYQTFDLSGTSASGTRIGVTG